MSNVLFYLVLAVLNGVFLYKNKVYYGNPINLLLVISILIWVGLTRLVYNVISLRVNFILAIILAVVMTSLVVVGLGVFVYFKLKKKNNEKLLSEV